MKYRKEKLERLARVAHLYYEDNKTQGEIADMLRVSRPLVSRMLNEARSIGIVEIRVRSLTSTPEILTEHLCQTYGLHSSIVVPDEESDDVTHYAMAQRLLTYIYEQNPAVVGVGWGTVIGLAAKRLESIQVPPLSIQTICPLLGNSNVLSRQYHPDEHVRMFAEACGAQPVFLHAPAYTSSEADANMFRETAQYQAVVDQWKKLDLAVVEIHDDSIVQRTAYRGQANAVGYTAGYGMDTAGKMVSLPYTIMRIPLDMLKRCRRIIGICTADTRIQALQSVLRAGFITDVLAPESVARQLVSKTQ